MKINTNIICFQIYYNCVIKLLITQFGLPSSLNYISDIIIYILTLMLLVNLSRSRNLIKQLKRAKLFLGATVIMLLLGTISALVNQTGIVLYVWGIRNMYRYYIFFIACIVFLRKENIEKIFKNLFYILLINILLVTYQYFKLNIKGDYLGGTFGTEQGANTYMNMFLVVVSIYYLSMYMKKKNSIIYPIVSLVGSLYIATLSELKIVFVEIMLILILITLIDRYGIKDLLKKMMIISIAILFLSIAIPKIYKLYPIFDDFFTLSNILTPNPNGYSNSGDLDRLTALNTLYDMFFNDNLVNLLFGFGIGSAEYSSFSFLTSDFYRNYEYLHYTWFSHAFMFIEYGVLGLISYIFTFISVFFDTFKNKYTTNQDKSLILTSRLTSIMCLLFIIYNAGLRTEGAYVIYLVLSIPYIVFKENEYISKK